MSKINSWYIHVDLDAFFASVEQLDHPEYRGKPVIVGGKPEDRRGVVSTASYEARKFGVHSAMPSFKAYQLCPQGIFVHGRHQRYSEISYQIMNILKDYSPDVEQMSIDEAFLDLTGTEQLFGSPEQTAKNIQKRIFDETGLTASIGLAQSKYFAKMASDINKPNGFYFVQPGTESEFMLRMPVKKIWGVGTKTQELLYNSGIKTTRDIYEKELTVLQFITGNSTGQFLYNIVRGISDGMFQKETKSHSISAETTFPYDVSDVYTIETTIMDLAHDVMFRLLRENCFSKTVMVKIRYEDFTTVSIQQTYNTNILTLDTLYKSAKQLFEKKYDTSRKVRLIGIGLENLESNDTPYQQDLFDKSTQKRQAVEKAILNMEKKHPEIKIRKARLLKNLIFLFIFLFGIKNQIKAELPSPEISGFWTSDLTQTINTSFGNNTSFAVSFGTPVFKQQVDLSIFYRLNPQWYFNCIFADAFNQNTFTLCFTKDSTLQKFYLSNRDIIFPKEYSVNKNGFGVPGGNNQAPGFYFHFEDIQNKKWSSDIMLRYDLTKMNNRTWYGNSLVNDTFINPQDFLCSKIFVIPNSFTDKIKDVYAQNKNGNFKDKYNIRYKKLSSSDYFLDKNNQLLIISNNAGLTNVCNILITFESDSDTDNFLTSLGDYSQPYTFLGEIQEYFNKNIKSYSFELESMIDNKKCIVLQKENLFSPFIYAGLYDSGILDNAQFDVIQKNNEQTIEKYKVFSYTEDFNFAKEDFFYDSHFYAQIKNDDYNLSDYTSAKMRYPFAQTDPYIYLTRQNYTDIILRCRLLNETSYYDIGKTASEGTVSVYINGKPDVLAVYDKNSGFVTLSKPVTNIDKIYITWAEESNQFDNGTLTAAAGFIYNITPSLKADTSLTVKWPVSSFIDYATYDNSLTGFASITAGINYSNENFNISDSLSAAFQNPNVKGKYNVELFTGDVSRTYYFTKQTDDAQLDSQISGYRIPVFWDFSNISNFETEKNHRDIKLQNGNLLFKSNELEIAIKSDQELEGYKIFVQLGIDFDNNDIFYENLPTWEITSLSDEKVLNQFDTHSTQWQNIRLLISESDRIKLYQNSDLRIIIEKNASETEVKKGTLYIGPYEPKITGCQVLENEKILVQTNTLEQGNNNFLTSINFTRLSSLLTEDEKQIKAISFFKEASFNDYEEIDFNLLVDFECDFTYILDSRTDYDFILDKALELTINKECLKLYKDSLKIHKIRIDLKNNKVYIDDNILSSTDYTLFINRQITPFRQIVIFKPSNDETTGTALLGNLFYNDNKIYSIIKNTIEAQYVFENDNAKSKTNISSVQNLQSDFSDTSAFINMKADTSLITKPVNISAGFEFSNSTKNIFDNGEHLIVSNYPLFKFIKFKEQFIYEQNSSSKSNYFALDFSQLNFPLEAIFSTEVQNSKNYFTQSNESDLNFKVNLKKFSLISKSSLALNQKTFDFSLSLNNNYFAGWFEMSKYQFSKGVEDAQSRTIDLSTTLYLELPDINFKPYIKFNLSENFTNTFLRAYNDTVSFELSVPFSISSNSFSFTWIKTAGDTTEKTDYFTNNYSVDFETLFKQQKNYSYFYSSILFADLFTDIKNKINSKQFYNSKYIFNYKRKLNNSLTDLFVPYTVSASILRDIYLTQNKNDLYQFKISTGNAAVNLFGATSKYKLFKWYTQDEFIINNSLIIRLPENPPKDFSYLYNFNSSALFYVNNANTLRTAVNLFIGSEKYFNITATQIWNHSKKSTIWFTNKKPGDFKRKEILNISVINKDYSLTQKYDYIHNLDIGINKNWTVNLNTDIFFLHEENKCSNIGLELTVGVKMEF